MRHRIAAAVTLAVLTLTTAAFGAREAETTTLRVVRAESFDGWVLDSAAAYASYQTHAAVIEGLLRPRPDGKGVEPGLATSWKHDPKAATWTFTLRANARFSDGSAVTAADVVFSFGVWKRGANFGASYGNIQSARAPNPRTVVFKLASSYDNTFLPLMSASVSGVMPRNFGGKPKNEYYKKPIGAGAFKVDSWTIGGRIVLSRNTFFYDPRRPRTDKVVIDVVADDNERRTLFEAGDADIVEYVPAATARQYDPSALEVLKPSQIEHLSLNVKRPPFKDVRVRRAVASAIDYRSIVRGPFDGFGAPARGILAPNLANWAPPTLPYFTTNLKQAKSLLASSSTPNGGAVELIYDAGQANDVLVAQILQSNLAKLGFDVKLSGLETGAFLDRAFSVDAEMMIWSYGAISPDVSDPLGWFLGTSWLFTGRDTGRLAKQFGAYAAAATAAKRRSVITAIQNQAIRDADAIALAEFRVVQAVNPKLKGFASTPWGLYFYDTISS
jgi:peptide/nickel transport system substrate-binding protein